MVMNKGKIEESGTLMKFIIDQKMSIPKNLLPLFRVKSLSNPYNEEACRNSLAFHYKTFLRFSFLNKRSS